MPMVMDLTSMPRLGLTLRAGEAGATRPISWVHSSELTDPARFLSGGELLLTTGLALPATASGQRDYVRGLSEAGLAGLGFGVDLGHDEVPAALLDAAEQAGLPVLEVPLDTPFIEIGKAVSQALAEQRSAEVRRTESARKALTAAAVHADDLGGVVVRLARELDCWAVFLDAEERVVRAEPSWAAAKSSAFAPDLERLRAARSPSSAGSCVDGESLAVHPLGGAHRLAGFLAVGRKSPFNPTEHHITHVASSLLTIALTQARPVADARLRAIALKLLLSGDRTAFDELSEPLGAALPDEPAVVAVGSGYAPSAVDDCAASGLLAGELEGRLVVVASSGRRLPTARHLGVSTPTGLDGLTTAYQQAQRALEAATRRAAAVSRFENLGVGLLNDFGGQDAVARAESVLHPLREHDGDLVRSLRTWLQHHGHWNPAAAALGVHRHTLRHRMDKVAELLGSPLDSPDVRSELWLALRLLP